MSLFRRSSRSTVRIVWALCLLAVTLSSVYIWRYQRARSADRARSAAAEVPAAPTRMASAAQPAAAPAPKPPPAEPVRLAARPLPGLLERAADALPADLTAATDAFTAGDVVTARRLLSRVIPAPDVPGDLVERVHGELVRIANATIFSRAIYPGDPLVSSYAVQKGDTLDGIARRHHVTAQLLATINQLADRNRLTVGRSVKVVNGPFNVRVRKSTYTLEVLLGDLPVRVMRCGLGVNGSTPTGRWVVRDKLANPGWTDPRNGQHYHPDDPENPIGEYWLALHGVEGEAIGRRGFGIHGTVDPDSIGRDMSLGCVRLAPADIEALFQWVVVNDTTVEIIP